MAFDGKNLNRVHRLPLPSAGEPLTLHCPPEATEHDQPKPGTKSQPIMITEATDNVATGSGIESTNNQQG